jgi:hypothetical protein
MRKMSMSAPLPTPRYVSSPIKKKKGVGGNQGGPTLCLVGGVRRASCAPPGLLPWCELNENQAAGHDRQEAPSRFRDFGLCSGRQRPGSGHKGSEGERGAASELGTASDWAPRRQEFLAFGTNMWEAATLARVESRGGGPSSERGHASFLVGVTADQSLWSSRSQMFPAIIGVPPRASLMMTGNGCGEGAAERYVKLTRCNVCSPWQWHCHVLACRRRPEEETGYLQAAHCLSATEGSSPQGARYGPAASGGWRGEDALVARWHPFHAGDGWIIRERSVKAQDAARGWTGHRRRWEAA